MNDFLIDKISGHYAASKSVAYRKSIQEMFIVFVNYLQDNNLTCSTLLQRGAELTDDFRIMRSDLTDEGFEVVKQSYDKWLRGIDRGKPISDVTILEKGLRKVKKT